MSFSAFLRNASNLVGWSTKRKFLIIESDDWGAIRMSSVKDYNDLVKKGVKASSADEERYLKNDALASEDDLLSLFETLEKFKDSKGKPAKFTAVSLSANPDFQKIKEDHFANYYYKPLPETLKEYPKHQKSFELWKEGIAKGVFVPQFHGREHLNVYNWLKALQQGEKDTLTAFEHGVYGITPRQAINHISYQAAFDFIESEELDYQKVILEDGLDLFSELFGYKASFFVPTNGPFNNALEEAISKKGIKYIGASKVQHMPIGQGKTKKVLHYIGQKNKFGQRYLTRNCFFEPSSSLKSDWVDSCLSEIEIAFKWNKPAVISSHRVNYIGWLNPSNKDKGLNELTALLSAVLKKWPDVEFISSDELGAIVSKEK